MPEWLVPIFGIVGSFTLAFLMYAIAGFFFKLYDKLDDWLD